MVSQTDSIARESVIVVMDANRNKGMVDALDWALKHVVRPKDTVIVVGVLDDIGSKKNSTTCFPINIGISIHGIWEKLEFSSGHAELTPRELGEEIERKREQYQSNLQPFYRQCKRNEVKLAVKLAAGICPEEITVQEAQNINTRWIVLDRHFRKHKFFIYGHVDCNVAAMKGKDVATLLPSRAPKPEYSSASCERAESATTPENQPMNDLQNGNVNVVEEGESSMPPAANGPLWYPLQWRAGYPREFSQGEIEVITNGFTEIIFDDGNIKAYEGVLQDTPVLVKSFQDDERFWSMLTILSRVRHRNIMNMVGYCCTGTNRLLISDYPFLCNVAYNLQYDTLASHLPWRARWYTAIEIGGSLRYLHEECPDGPIVHQHVCSSDIVYSHGYLAMLGNFITAKWLKDDVPCNGNSTVKCPKPEEEKPLYVDVHDYGVLLVELITGKVANCFPHENEGQSLIDWALPLIESGSVTQVMDPRLTDNDDDSRAVHYMAHAALLCLKNDSGRSFSISEVLAVVRGDQHAIL
ncbi:hypothetical protein PTKIN_Ptkin02bG0190700 [Pterospermum kingtungense]